MLVIDDSTTWPDHVKELLAAAPTHELLTTHRYIDHIIQSPHIEEIVDEVEQYARDVGLAGFHCTKQGLGVSYAETGLRILNFEQHHSEFLSLVRENDMLNDECFQEVERALERWRENHEGSREGMIWFCLSRHLALDSGTSEFFTNFGGEAIYRAFTEHREARDWLASIGEPVVVEVRLQPSQLVLYQSRALGRSLVSHYASKVNRRFYIHDVEGHSRVNVPASEVVAVHAYEDFARRHRPS